MNTENISESCIFPYVLYYKWDSTDELYITESAVI